MIAPKVNFDLAMKEQPPPIVKKPVSFFNNDKQAPAPTPTQVKQQAPAPTPTQVKQQAPPPAPAHANAHVQEAEDITTELEEMSIGLQGLMEGNVKATKTKRKLTPAQTAHLAKMRQQKALKREQTKSTQAQTPLPSAPQQSTIQQNQQHQPYENLNDIIAKEFEKLYSAKESIRQREKAIRQETKQKVLSKLMAQQKLTAQAPVPTPAPAPTPAPQPIESNANKKLRYKMNPFGGGFITYYE